MLVRQGNPAEYQELPVHAELSQHIADLMARIKLGGGAGLKSELNFCLYCRTRLSSLSVPAGFCREGMHFSLMFTLSNACVFRLSSSRSRRGLEQRLFLEVARQL